MLDKRFILDNPELVQQNCNDRGLRADVSRFVQLENQCRLLQQEIEELSRQANVVSKSIGQAKDDAERNSRKEADLCPHTRPEDGVKPDTVKPLQVCKKAQAAARQPEEHGRDEQP